MTTITHGPEVTCPQCPHPITLRRGFRTGEETLNEESVMVLYPSREVIEAMSREEFLNFAYVAFGGSPPFTGTRIGGNHAT